MQPAPRRTVATVLAACAVLTLCGFLLKAQCIPNYERDRDHLLCSNDIQVLYRGRGLAEHRFPYVHGALVDGQLTGGTIEYPVLTGVFAWFPALFSRDEGQYLELTALLLAPFSLVTALLLTWMTRERAFVYALAPALVWHSFHNWDLLVVAATVGACYAWWRGHGTWCAVWLGVGSCLKLWPGLVLLPLLLDRLRAGDRPGLVRAAAAFVGVLAVVNVPFLLINPSGWAAPYAFQALRPADVTSNSIWFWGLPGLSTAQLNRLVPALLIVAFTAAAAYGWRVSERTGRYPVLQVSAAMLCAFMVLGKAHSPQYTLWLLPFLVLLRLRWGWYVAYLAFDATMYVGIFRWYDDLAHGIDFGPAKQAVVIGVWGRAVMLVLLFVVFLRSDTALVPDQVPAAA